MTTKLYLPRIRRSLIQSLGIGYPFAVIFAGVAFAREPAIPGLHQKHPLDERQQGLLLIAELRCAACHEGMADSGMKAAPDLRDAGTRLKPEFIRKFIATPAATHPGTTMPDTFGMESDAGRKSAADAIASYLSTLKQPEPPAGAAGDPKAGRDLYQSIGCVTCHPPRDAGDRETASPGAPTLSHVPDKYRDAGTLAAFLIAPLKSRPSGRMPDMGLSPVEAASLAAYLMAGNTAPSADAPPPDPAGIDAGKAAFNRFGCASCHQTEDAQPAAAKSGPPLAGLDATRGCLSNEPGKAPRFGLSESRIKAIRIALAAPTGELPVADSIKVRLTQLNCIACHTRDDYGGVLQDRNAFFKSTEEALGNESRIPPPLTLVGAKLKPEWLNQVLYDRARVRPYMETRMPHYGESALLGLAGWFSEHDKLDAADHNLLGPDDVEKLDKAEVIKLRNGGQQLLGDTGLNCIACHNFNGIDSPAMKGIDIMTTYQRLQPGWFAAYMKNPAAFRPGIIMPGYWPDGKALQTGVLDGDTRAQLQAMWYYFSLGRSARDPSGLRAPDTKLVVADTPVLYRGRSQVAGFRGIAVGYPGGLNYAFNAQNGALAALWKGGFVNVNWKSQGAGDFTPIGRIAALPQDVAFVDLKEDSMPWPLRPVTNKEHPVNPDPLYPRQHGYAFRGYSFDASGFPTLRYRIGDVAVEDRCESITTAGKPLLRRMIRLSSPAAGKLHFRALTGKIETEAGNAYKTPEIRIRCPQGEPLLRPFGEDRELLLRLDLPAGNTDLNVDYELLH